MIREITEKNNNTHTKNLILNNVKIIDSKDIVNTQADTFSQNPFSNTKKSQTIKEKVEKVKTKFQNKQNY